MTRPEDSRDATQDAPSEPQGGTQGGTQQAPHDFTGPLSPRVKLLVRALMAVCALLFALDLFITRKTHAPGEGLPGFYAIYGFVGCVFLVLAAKLLRRAVMRREDYWDPPAGEAPAGDAAAPGGDDETEDPGGNH